MDLTICQECKEQPATYGDGVTWSRCSACQRKHTQENTPEGATTAAETTGPEAPEQSFEHKIVEGLTSIIIPVYMVNYTLFHYTGNCIGSVREHTDEKLTPYEIVVVDNGSPIKPPNLQSYYAHRIIQNEENLGVTKAWNKAIRMSIGEYIVLLNNDVQVFDHWLEDMKAVLDHSGFDLVMAHPMYSLTEPFARAVESKKIRDEVLKKAENNKSLLTSDFKDFSCVMFKRSLLDEIGLFDETFFNYCSDSDLFKRMDEAGKTYTCVESVPTSHISDATGFSISETPDIMNQDKAKFAEKWANRPITPGPSITQAPMKQVENLFRTLTTGDAIYFISGEKYHHIKNPDTLHALGFEFGQEQMLVKSEVEAKYSRGEDLTMENVEKYKNA